MSQRAEASSNKTSNTFEIAPASAANTSNVPPDDTASPPSQPSDTLDAPSDDAHRSVNSVHSDSSTLPYRHEPFDQFNLRVQELCYYMWPSPKKSLIERLSVKNVVGALHAKKIFRSFCPSSSREFLVERLKGDSYIRIAGITILAKGGQESRLLILRVPRHFDARPDREVAALRFVRQHTSIPVVEVVGLDFTNENPPQKTHVIQKRIEGSDLQDVILDLTHQQHCIIAKELGRILLAMQAVKNPTAGVIEGTVDKDGSQQTFVRPFELKTPLEAEQEQERILSINGTERHDDNDDDEEDESSANETPNSLTCQELKHLFEEMMGGDFLHYAYEPQYQLRRTLIRLTIKGIRSSEHLTSADKFLAKWQAMYQFFVSQETIISQGEGKVPKSRFPSEINFSQKQTTVAKPHPTFETIQPSHPHHYEPPSKRLYWKSDGPLLIRKERWLSRAWPKTGNMQKDDSNK